MDDTVDSVTSTDSIDPDSSVVSRLSVSRDYHAMNGQVSDDMEEIKYGSGRFLKIAEQQQRIRNYLLLLMESTTLSEAIMVDMTFFKQNVNEQKLAMAGFKFIVTERYVTITAKAFLDDGADDSLISKRL